MAGELGFGPGLLVGAFSGVALFLLLTGGRLPRARPARLGRTLGTRWASLGLAAGLEEVVWRGLVLGLLALAVGSLTALAVSTAGFAAWHWRAQGRGCSVHLLTGATFGAAYLAGGLAAAILAHGVYNVLVDWAVRCERARLRGP